MAERMEVPGLPGHDFSHIRIHSGHVASSATATVGASAFTVGYDIVFGPGYLPGTSSGKTLLAHELMHVVQQDNSPDSGGQLRVQSPGSEAEAEAATAGRRLRLTPTRLTPQPRTVARQPTDITLEVPTPEEHKSAQQHGVQLPSVSEATADPRRGNPDYIDRRLEAVGFSIYSGGYVLYCTGYPQPIFVPERFFDFSGANWTPTNLAIFPSYDAAQKVIPLGPYQQGKALPYAYYRGPGGLIAPTAFSRDTTPRIISTALKARQELAETVQQQLTVLAITLVGGMVLKAVIGRLLRIGSEAPPIEGTAAASGRALARAARERGDDVIVNIGGAGAPHEPPGAINVNNQAVPRKGIPNLVEADGSDIGKLFNPGSVDRVEGHNMAPGVINWKKAAPGAFRVLRPGGKFEYYWRGANPDARACAQALRAAGFRDVEVVSDVLVKATRP